MARTKTKYQINGKTYIFDNEKFRRAIDSKKNDFKKTVGKKASLETICDDINSLYNNCFDFETLHKWVYSTTSPSKDTVEILAKYLDINILNLLKESEELPVKYEYSDTQLKSVKIVYDNILKLLDDCNKTLGFMFLSSETRLNDGCIISNQEEFNEGNTCLYYLQSRIDHIKLLLEQERFYLHSTPIYSFLAQYIEENLTDFCEFVADRHIDESFITIPVPGFKDKYLEISDKLDKQICTLA